MILKIKQTKHNEPDEQETGLIANPETTSYHMFDGIRHLKRSSGNGICCAKTKEELLTYLKKHKIDYAIVDFNRDYSATSVMWQHFYHISIEREPGNWTEIIFDEQAFICNDNGKTLEKLDAGN